MSDTPPVPPVPPTSGVPPVEPPPASSVVPPPPPAVPDPTVPDPARPNPYAQDSSYATPAYATPAYSAQAYTPAPVTNTLAIVALILAFFVPLGGVICGHIALGQIKRTGQGGHGLALAGTIIGYAFIALGLLVGIIYAVVIVAAVSSGNRYGNF